MASSMVYVNDYQIRVINQRRSDVGRPALELAQANELLRAAVANNQRVGDGVTFLINVSV